MTTMKAVRIRSFGGPEVLEFTEIEKPVPKDEEVLIRVRAASVNPVEIGRLIDQGRVHPHISAVFELKQAAEAQAQLERRHAQGKVVLQMG